MLLLLTYCLGMGMGCAGYFESLLAFMHAKPMRAASHKKMIIFLFRTLPRRYQWHGLSGGAVAVCLFCVCWSMEWRRLCHNGERSILGFVTWKVVMCHRAHTHTQSPLPRHTSEKWNKKQDNNNSGGQSNDENYSCIQASIDKTLS